MTENRTHKRRERYSGTHPKKFSQKYKELNPEKYPETIEHVRDKGITPAGTHIPIMVDEILDVLRIEPGMTGLDATLGYGGHTTEMLKCLKGSGHIYGLDIDPIEIKKTEERLDAKGFGTEIFTARNMNFSEIRTLSEEVGKFDFVLADLGVSSMQIDNPTRGFSYKMDGPLDLRLNPESGISASERLSGISEDELYGMLRENADEPYAAEIAKKVTDLRKRGRKMVTTTDLAEAVLSALSFLPEREREEAVKKSCQRTFQAIRIDINHEYEVLYQFLSDLPSVMKPGGRAAILTFHSGEDRLVKRSFKELKSEGSYSEIARDVIRPGAKECASNSRARSTKLRYAVRSCE